ncbi:Beta-L-arabinobiosidase precursor [Posidoniimonas corsicana]|uniref:Beta-L-arabinobiosidase n=1 Tax=Posidoniimonas corsicana TaxID=1938618 RepID=A0A5C5UVC2_9BACT|nr:glycosyl hydrolase family 65 protein [Posidoniimonas corsicana]TWT29769.1 Beta-L-arabinobiosidase precursor [Posidoniimonas corsicana]
MSTFSGRPSSVGAALALAASALAASAAAAKERESAVLSTDTAYALAERFNACDAEDVRNLVPNSDAGEWIAANAPRFDCPSGRLVETYYFRWWTFRKHIVQTPHGRVLTEFITPVSHAGPYNTVSCAVGHHIAEGRWLRDQALLNEYMSFWLRSGADGGMAPHYHKFSNWNASALYERAKVTGDWTWLTGRLDDLVADYQAWEAERQLLNGLFWQHDVKDGMEESISGGRRVKNVRPTINSYMVANARAISAVARRAGRDDLADVYSAKADQLQEAMVEAMWDPDAQFYKVRLESGQLSNAREAIGYIPWVFGIAHPQHTPAWRQVTDRAGFWAPAGLTTAERRHPEFRTHGTGTCEWDGAVWPFATSQTLTGMARLLRDAEQDTVTRDDYFEQLLRYANSHQQNGAAYIGEYLDEVTGEWLITGPKAMRSRFYNHSTFNDLIISGLIGVLPQEDGKLRVHPLVPPNAWNWFCLDGTPCQGHDVTVVWDRDGQRYGRQAGLTLMVDGQTVAHRPDLGPLTYQLLPTTDPTE